MEATRSNRQVLFVGIFVYTILAFLSLLFYLERTAFVDIAFHLFHIIKDGDFAIQNHRFGAALTQLFPIIGLKVGLSLSAIMKLYSLGFILYYFGLFLICVKVLKAPRFGLAVLLLNTLMVTDTFYWVQSELQQGLALLPVYFALLFRIQTRGGSSPWAMYLLLAVLNISLAFFHPLLLIPFVFCSLFLWIDNNSIRKPLLLSLLLFLVIILIKNIFFKTNYDSGAMKGLNHFATYFPDYFSLPSFEHFFEALFQKFYLLFVVLIGMTGYYIKKKAFHKLALMLAFSIGYSLLVNVSYPNGADAFYIENLYLPLAVFVVIPFAIDVPVLSNRLWVLLAFLVLCFRIAHIGYAHKFYTDRVAYLNAYMDETATHNQKKIVIAERHFPMDTLLMTWGTPYEIWLLSTVRTGETRSIVITNNIKRFNWTKSFQKKYVPSWGVFEYNDLPSKYFQFRDSSLYNFIE